MPVKLEPYKRKYNGNRIFADTIEAIEEKWSKKAFFSMFVISMETVIHHLSWPHTMGIFTITLTNVALIG